MKIKEFILVLIALFMFSTFAFAKQVTLQFAWDPNIEPDMAGYAIFHRLDGEAYNYDNPLDPDCTIVAGECFTDPVAGTCEYTYTFEAPDGVISTHKFVARARDTQSNWSEDSNEVSITFDLAPIDSPTILTAVYNEVANTVDIAFQQSDYTRVEKWELYVANVSGGPYTKADTIMNPETGDTGFVSWTIPGDGNYYFVLVAFTPEGVYSVNSNQLYVQVVKSPSKVKEFRLKIRVQ